MTHSANTNTHPCANCGAEVPELYCSHCGQENINYNESLRELIPEVLHEYFGWDSAVFASIPALLFKPGYLTNEFNAGRRMKFISPIRLYLITSAVCFFLMITQIHHSNPESGGATTTTIDSSGGKKTITVSPFTATPPNVTRSSSRNEKVAQPQTAQYSANNGTASKQYDTLTTAPPGNFRVSMTGPYSLDSLKNAGGPVQQIFFTKLGGLQGHLKEFNEALSNNYPTAMFLLLPFVALLFKLLYIRRKRFYIEHLIFALHVHSFAYFMLSLVLIDAWLFPNQPGSYANIAVMLLLIVYVFAAMKRVYQQGWIATTIKFLLAGFSYFVLVMIFFSVTVMFTIFFSM